MATNNSCNYVPTQYNTLVGGANGTITNVAPSATSGVPLVSGGASADPSYSTAVVAGGGTGVTSTTAYTPICGGTTATGALQSIASTGTSGQVLTSNGAAALPTFQTLSTNSPYYFKAAFTANQSNVTGDNTSLNPIVWNTTLVNQGSAYNTGTGYFTCPATGFYFFSCNIFYTGMTSSHNDLSFTCQNNTVNEYAWTVFQNPYPIYNVASGGRGAINASGSIYCTAGDTVRTIFGVAGGTKVITIYGGVGHQSEFSGFYIGA